MTEPILLAHFIRCATKHFVGLGRGNGSVWFSPKNDIRRNNLTTGGQVLNLMLSDGARSEVSGATVLWF